jgi:putative nucleotidyltransferase with HDIG domain
VTAEEDRAGLKEAEPDYRVAELDDETCARLTVGFKVWPLSRLTVLERLPVDVHLPFQDDAKQQMVMLRVAESNSAKARTKLDHLKRLGVTNVFVPEDQVRAVFDRQRQELGKRLRDPYLGASQKADAIYDHAVQIVEHSLSDDRLGENVQIGREFVEDVTEYVSGHIDVARHLGDILSRDYSLYTHLVNVCLLCLSLARYLELSLDRIVAFGLGGLFHDIGKRTISEKVLNKQGPLNEAEWEIMRRHPSVGFEMLRTSADMPIESLRMVYQHHENLDGTGYPRGLCDRDIPDQCRLIRILDAYDALTSTRVYKEAAAPWEAIQIIRQQMDGQVCQKLLKVVIGFLGWMNPDNIRPIPPGWIAG